jgi:hypothetical protein
MMTVWYSGLASVLLSRAGRLARPVTGMSLEKAMTGWYSRLAAVFPWHWSCSLDDPSRLYEPHLSGPPKPLPTTYGARPPATFSPCRLEGRAAATPMLDLPMPHVPPTFAVAWCISRHPENGKRFQGSLFPRVKRWHRVWRPFRARCLSSLRAFLRGDIQGGVCDRLLRVKLGGVFSGAGGLSAESGETVGRFPEGSARP